MKKNDIFRQAAQHEMPDIEQVRKECIIRYETACRLHEGGGIHRRSDH